MPILTSSFTTFSDADLLAEVTRLAAGERHATARLVGSLAELDARRLYLGRGFSSMFTYCTQVLRLSEHAAYNRIEAARSARRFPIILDRLADGSISLTTVCLLAAHLTPANHREVLDAAQQRPSARSKSWPPSCGRCRQCRHPCGNCRLHPRRPGRLPRRRCHTH